MTGSEKGKGLEIPIRQQDGSTVTLWYPDSTHNRQLQDFIWRNEPFNPPSQTNPY